MALLGRLGVEEGIGLHVDAQQGRTTALGGHICAVRDTGPRQHLHNNHDDSNKQQAKQEGVGVSIFAQIANPSMAQDRSDNASVLREARQADRDPSNKQLQARMRATGHHSNNTHTPSIPRLLPKHTHTSARTCWLKAWHAAVASTDSAAAQLMPADRSSAGGLWDVSDTCPKPAPSDGGQRPPQT